MTVHSLPWYYAPDLPQTGETVLLSGEEWHHCHHVLRMDVGESLVLFDGKGRVMEGRIAATARQNGTIGLLAERSADFPVPRPYQLTVAFAPTKNIDRTEWAIEKVVELGIDAIVLLACDHAERSHIRTDRLEKIILSAAKQSRKPHLPVLHDFVLPNVWVTQFRKEQPEAQVLCCHLSEDSVPLTENYQAGKDVLMLIGPEGGFSVEETTQLVQRGARLVTLGPYRLRVETAVIAACNMIHTLNDLKN